MSRVLLLATALAAVIASGLVHGSWTHRWVGTEDTGSRASGRLCSLQPLLAEWEAQELKLDTSELARAKVADHFARLFVHRRLRTEVSVLILRGSPGPIAAHTPDVCYQSGGYQMVGHQDHFRLPAKGSCPQAEFWVASFRKQPSNLPDRLRIFWSWTTAGNWQAPEHPRFVFPSARHTTLYKMYVIRRLENFNQPVEKDPSLELLQLLIPELQKCLFASNDDFSNPSALALHRPSTFPGVLLS